MIVVEYRRIELDHCTSCQGIWFDAGELELLLKSLHVADTQPLFKDILSSPEAPSAEKKRKCPICGRRMRKATIGKPEIMIDACGREHGLWFDGGEVSQLVRQLTGAGQPAEASGEKVVDFLGEVFKAP